MPDEDAFLQSLRETFKVEADEHLQAIATGLLQLEKSLPAGEQRRVVETVFRAAHSLKGAARAVNFSDVEAICESLENVFAAWKREESGPTLAMLDSLHRSLDSVSKLLTAPANQPQAPTSPAGSDPLPQAAAPPVSAIPLARVQAGPVEAVAPATPSADTVRISVAKLDARLLEAEEMLTAKLTAAQRAADLTALAGHFEEWRKEWTKVQPDARLLRQGSETAGGNAAPPGLPRRVDFFDWSHDYLRTVENKVAALRPHGGAGSSRGRQARGRFARRFQEAPDVAALHDGRVLSQAGARYLPGPGQGSAARPARRRGRNRQAHSRGNEGPAHPPAAQLCRSRNRTTCGAAAPR